MEGETKTSFKTEEELQAESPSTPTIGRSPNENRKANFQKRAITLGQSNFHKKPKTVLAIKDFLGQDPQELSFVAGDTIILLEIDKTPWGKGMLQRTGNQGWFPMECVIMTSPDMRNREGSLRVDHTSIIDRKPETREQLDRKLPSRPEKEELRSHNILVANSDVDPGLQSVQIKLVKSRKMDFLTNFLRKKKERDILVRPLITVSKPIIAFENKILDVGDTVVDEFELKNKEFSKLKWALDCNTTNQPFLMTFEPANGSLSKNLVTRDILANILVSSSREKIGTILIKIQCLDSVFGRDPYSLPMVRDPDVGVDVPAILYTMKQSLKKYDGFRKEGIFRLAGDANVISYLRDRMDKKLFTEDADCISVATLMKVWYRELPEPVLQQLSKETLHNEDPVECFKAVDALPEPPHNLLQWLIVLLHECSRYSDESKMTVENLAIVVAPNLYKLEDGIDPVEGLVLSQKAAKFLSNVIHGYHQLLTAHGTSPFRKVSPGSPPVPITPKPPVLPKPTHRGSPTTTGNGKDEDQEDRFRAYTVW